MKSLFYITLFSLATISTAQANQTDPQPMDFSMYKLCNSKVMMPGGTLVLLEINEIKNSDLTAGRTVEMRVFQDVTIKEDVVIRTGALAIGRIKSVDPGGYSTKASITIELFSVTAVDGQQVPLFGNEQTFLSAVPSQPSYSEANARITAQTRNNMKIDVD